jgi:hypothetical protein
VSLPALVIVAAIILGALSALPMLAWAIHCLRRAGRRAEGASILGAGVLAAALLMVAGALTAPPGSAGVLRPQAFVVIAGAFGWGAAGGKVLHLVGQWWRGRRAHPAP